MGLLRDADKEKVKRAIPKASNKIVDVTVARLYIAYPDPGSWTYTGLSGAIGLVNDLVGNTFFLKLVDISVSILVFEFVRLLGGRVSGRVRKSSLLRAEILWYWL